MKLRLTFLFLIITFSVMGQNEVPFEQIAFDFYKDEILKANPVNTTLTLWTELDKKEYLIFGPICLTDFKFKSGDSLKVNTSRRTILEFKADSRFTVKEHGTGTYPRVYLTVSFSNKADQHIVTVFQNYKEEGVTYHIVMDDNGRVRNWCKAEWIE